MSWWFIIFLIVAVSAVVAWVVRRLVPTTLPSFRGLDDRPNPTRLSATLAAVGLTVLAGILLFLSSFTLVGTKNIGIETSFNRPVGTMANGWNWHAPWNVVNEWDGKLQNLAFSDTDIKDVEETGPGIQVRLANQSVATIDLIFQVRYTTNDGILQLFRDYATEVSVKTNLVRKELQAELNNTFGTYDPISSLSTVGTERTPTVGMPQLGSTTLENLRKKLPAGIEAVTLTIVMPHYDKDTESRIAAFNVSTQNTAIAEQDKKTAELVRQANDLLTATTASDYQQCLSMLERVKKAGGSWDGFQCSATGVIVSAK